MVQKSAKQPLISGNFPLQPNPTRFEAKFVSREATESRLVSLPGSFQFRQGQGYRTEKLRTLNSFCVLVH